MADQPKRPGKPPERARRPDDEDEDEAPRPKKKLRTPEAGDDVPRPKKKPKVVDDDDDDAPRPKKKKSGGVEKIIPYKNKKALWAYYCSVFGLIPFANFILGPIAVILGILALKDAAKKPKIGGKGHAFAGIILGPIEFIGWPIIAIVLNFYGK
ncbi:DUF4190 domain-containing protein [Zavarzinella formosa]|uniref:DUF4190 domain-containing protein n=1 Tax=Zavarzinella formosa TaxID=360055 RepID=UPI00031190BF|nr:DUF4190 domain-containing protein [Zavarzinella formosa]